jgi:hypothetical protein
MPQESTNKDIQPVKVARRYAVRLNTESPILLGDNNDSGFDRP